MSATIKYNCDVCGKDIETNKLIRLDMLSLVISWPVSREDIYKHGQCCSKLCRLKWFNNRIFNRMPEV